MARDAGRESRALGIEGFAPYRDSMGQPWATRPKSRGKLRCTTLHRAADLVARLAQTEPVPAPLRPAGAQLATFRRRGVAKPVKAVA